MAYYAFLDANNIVTQVISGKDESEPPGDWETVYGAKRTSFNTKGGVHYDPITGQPSADQSKAFRKNYAGIGYSYDPVRDAFIPPPVYPSWVLDEDSCQWKPPVPVPEDGKKYAWSEENVAWVEIP